MSKQANIHTLKPGDKLVADGGFACLKKGAVREVKMSGHDPYIECADGKHLLDGQKAFDDSGDLVGLTVKE